MREDWLVDMETDTLRALYRIAKDPAKGALPFFRDARAMIALRDELDRIPRPRTITVPR
jgi:hypothetical protein